MQIIFENPSILRQIKSEYFDTHQNNDDSRNIMVRKEKKSEILIFLVKSRSLRQVFGLVTLKISSKFQRGFETVQFCHFEHF